MANERSFLGTGWAFPPSFAAAGAGVELVSGPEDIHQSLQILFATQLGERVMQEAFGCEMSSYVFEEVDGELISGLQETMSDAILFHEPRIELDRLEISESDSQQGLLLITLEYTVLSTNSRYNMVYPYYLNEASIPGL